MKSRRSRPFRQLGLGLLLLGCLPPCLGLRPRSLPTSLGYFAFLFLVGFRCVTFSCFSGGQPRRKRRFPTPHLGFVSVRLSLHCLCFSSCASFAFVLVGPCSNPGRSSQVAWYSSWPLCPCLLLCWCFAGFGLGVPCDGGSRGLVFFLLGEFR